MKNVRNLLAAAVLAALAACSGDATAPEAARHPSRPALDKVAPDTATPPAPDSTDPTDDGASTLGSGLIGSSG